MAGCGFNCAKYILFFLNAIFWLIGLGILAIGIWMAIDAKLFEYLDIGKFDKEQIKYGAYVLIAAGAFIVIIAFCGCCGAIKESQCLLGFYAFCILLIIGLEIAAGVLAYLKKDEILKNISDVALKGLREDYSSAPNNTLGLAWNKAMIEFKCCGVEGPSDWDTSKWAGSTVDAVPQACCKQLSDNSYKNPVAENKDECQADARDVATTSQYLHTTGCKDAIKAWLESKAVILIAVAFAVAAFEVFVLILALCVCCQIRNKE